MNFIRSLHCSHLILKVLEIIYKVIKFQSIFFLNLVMLLTKMSILGCQESKNVNHSIVCCKRILNIIVWLLVMNIHIKFSTVEKIFKMNFSEFVLVRLKASVSYFKLESTINDSDDFCGFGYTHFTPALSLVLDLNLPPSGLR